MARGAPERPEHGISSSPVKAEPKKEAAFFHEAVGIPMAGAKRASYGLTGRGLRKEPGYLRGELPMPGHQEREMSARKLGHPGGWNRRRSAGKSLGDDSVPACVDHRSAPPAGGMVLRSAARSRPLSCSPATNGMSGLLRLRDGRSHRPARRQTPSRHAGKFFRTVPGPCRASPISPLSDRGLGSGCCPRDGTCRTGPLRNMAHLPFSL